MMVARSALSLSSARGVAAAFVPPVTHLCRPSFLRSAQRNSSSAAFYETRQDINEEAFPNSKPGGIPVGTKGGLRRNTLSMANQQSTGFVLLASATSNRLGTGVGVSLVMDPLLASRDAAAGAAVATSFGVYFQQHRSLYEREYTSLIVALQWLQQNPPAVTTATKQPPAIITLPIREDVVYHQLLGDYPVEKESLRALHQVAIELIQDLQIQIELCPKSAPFQQCRHLASRVLLMERSDRGFSSFVDPLDPYSSPTSVEEESFETVHIPVLEEYYGDGIISMVESLDDRATPLDFGKEQAGRMTDQVVETSAQQQDCSTARPEIDPSRKYLLQFDGGARGNPHGPSGCGMVLYDEERNQIWSGAKYLGEHMTNNQAEYTGIVLGLQTAVALGIRKLRCQGDSELIIKQLKGQYKVKNEGLKPFHRAAAEAIRCFDFFEADHIVRKDNAVADSLANQAMDSKTSIGFS